MNTTTDPKYTVLDGVRAAVDRASRDREGSFVVYVDRAGIVYVRDSAAAPPPDARVECIAQAWDATHIQIRRSGASSEWVEK